MLACYVDESGDTGKLPTATSPIQPVLAIIGLTLDLARLREFTLDFIDLKRRFFPGRFPAHATRLDGILIEIKGSDVGAAFRQGHPDHQRRHHHVAFLDCRLDLIERYDCRLFGRVWIKPIGGRMDGWSIYTYSTQFICMVFDHLLQTRDTLGMVIPDSRAKPQDRRVSKHLHAEVQGRRRCVSPYD